MDLKKTWHRNYMLPIVAETNGKIISKEKNLHDLHPSDSVDTMKELISGCKVWTCLLIPVSYVGTTPLTSDTRNWRLFPLPGKTHKNSYFTSLNTNYKSSASDS